jgi:hypothetical protein
LLLQSNNEDTVAEANRNIPTITIVQCCRFDQLKYNILVNPTRPLANDQGTNCASLSQQPVVVRRLRHPEAQVSETSLVIDLRPGVFGLGEKPEKGREADDRSERTIVNTDVLIRAFFIRIDKGVSGCHNMPSLCVSTVHHWGETFMGTDVRCSIVRSWRAVG